MNRNSVLIIPALNPDEKLIKYVEQLVNFGFQKIIIIDDGSLENCKNIFSNLAEKQECDLLIHAKNMGKGRALKDALNYYLVKYSKLYKGVITVDSDGQHMIEDILKIDDKIGGVKGLILGVRDFNNSSVPFKSKFGNKITHVVLKIFIGGNITDTQTGLRGISNDIIYEYLSLYGERFEYETGMLIETIKKNIAIEEIAIRTVYIDGNRETHFRPVKDSIAIYMLIFSTFIKYIASSLSSFVIDYVIFCILLHIFRNMPDTVKIWLSTVLARIVSSIYNYSINKNIVFKSKNDTGKAFIKYYILCGVQMCFSAIFVLLLSRTTLWKEELIKLLVDIVLFFMSYIIQTRVIFKCERNNL